MVQDTPSRKLDQYIVRFPDGMRDQLKKAAKENNRSLNAEIIARLESYQSLKAEQVILPERLKRKIERGASINQRSLADEVILTLETHYKLPEMTIQDLLDIENLDRIFGKDRADELRRKVASGEIKPSSKLKIVGKYTGRKSSLD